MAEAGNSLDETIALITAANTIVQNPNTVGTALKTLSLRIRGVKTELEEAGLETDGMAETTSQLQEKLRALTDGKVDIMVDANNFKDTTQILREMAKEWEHMTDVEQAAALELLGGKRQANTLSAIIANFDIVEDAIKSSENSAGSALEENEKVLDSIQGRINQFNNALQTFWNNLLDSDVIKFFITLGTEIIKLASAFGEVRTVIFAILMYFNMSKKYPFDLAKMLFGSKGVNGIISGLSKIKKALADIGDNFGNTHGTSRLALMAPGLPSPDNESPKSLPPSSSGGYANTDAKSEPIDFDKVYGSNFSRMWKNHMSRLRTSINKVKQDFTDIWQHHNDRVAQSAQYASSQFTKLKTSASNAFNAMSKMVKDTTSNIRNAFSKLFASMGGKKTSATAKDVGVIPYIGSEQETTKQANRFNQIWQNHMARLRESIGRVKQDFSTIWQHHNERVAESVKYAGKQFDKLRVSASNVFKNISQSVFNAVNNIRSKFGQIADIMMAKTTASQGRSTKSTKKNTSTATSVANIYKSRKYAGDTGTVDFDKLFNQTMWQRHMDRVRVSAKRVKDDLSTIWENHNARVEQSVAYASQQFDRLKSVATQKIRGIVQVVGNITNSIRDSFSKMFAVNGVTKQTAQQELLKYNQVVPYDITEQGSSQSTKRASRFNQMWQDHISRLRDSVRRLKSDFSTLWQHHTDRMADSVKNVSAQFNKMKTGVVGVIRSVSKTITNASNGMRNSFVKATSKAWYEDETGRVRRAEVLPSNLPGEYEATENSYSKIDEIIAKIRVNIDNTVQRGKTAFANLAYSVGAQFNQIKNNIGSSIHNTINNIVSSVKNAAKIASDAFKNVKLKFGKSSNTIITPIADDGKSSDKTKSNASRVAAEVSRIWKQHIANLKNSYGAIKDEITTIWANHKIRVRESVAHAAKDFNNLKTTFSKVASAISAKVHNIGVAFKVKFGDAFKHVQNGFSKFSAFVSNVFNKIKTGASNTAKAFKERLGHTQNSATQGASATVDPTSWLSAGSQLGNNPLSMGDDAVAKIDAVNDAMKNGQVALNDYMSGLGGADNALKAYVASLDGGQASIAGFNNFINTHNAGLKASGAAARLAAIGHAALNAALSMGLSVLIQFAMEGLTKLIEYLKDVVNPTEKLAEDISDLKSEMQNTESEIDSINGKLDTCRERMAELLALPTLSFTEQEELDNLEKEVALLERKLALEKALFEREEAKLIDDTQEYIIESWDEQGTYNVKNTEKNRGVIRKDEGWSGFFDDSQTTAEVLNESMQIYKDRENAISDAENVLLNLKSSSRKEREEVIRALNIDDDDLAGDISIFDKNKALSGDADAFDKVIDAAKSVNIEVAKSIDDVFSDPQYAGLTYGMSEDIDTFLDEFYAYQDKWNVILGSSNKSDSIMSLFDKTSTAEMQALGKQLQDIVDDESLSLEQQNAKIKEVVNSVNLENDAYNRLKTTMDTVGVSAQDIADYFTLANGVFDSDTIEGITAQYAHGLNVFEQLKAGVAFDTSDGIVSWDNLFEEDDAGKLQTRVDRFGAILKGVDETTRNTFIHLAESVKNGSLTWEQAMDSFQASGLVAACRLVEAEVSNLNTEVFKDLGDTLSGVIDTFGEFGDALESVANSMNTLSAAQSQMANSGRISVKTALELMQSTDNWNELLEIENGNIRLVDNATEILVQSKLDLIKSNLQAALATVEAQLAEITATEASAEMAYTIEESTNLAVTQLAGNMAYLTKLMEAYARQVSGENVDIDEYIKQAESAKETVLTQTDYKKNSAERIGTEALEQKKKELEAMLGMYEGIDTAGEYSDYYDYDKNPGDKDLDGSDSRASDALESIRKKYERQIELNDNKQTYLQNEIDRLQAEDEPVSKSYYEEQIALEEEKLALYEQERQALLKLDMTDEVASALWEVEHAIQESTKRMVEFRQSIVDLYVEAFDKVIGAYDNSDDFFSDQQNYIDKYQELMELQGGEKTAGGIKDQIGIEQKKMEDNIAELNALRESFAFASSSGYYDEDGNFVHYLQEGSEEWVEYQDKIRAAEEAVLDNKIAIEQYREELKQLSVDAFDVVREAFGNKDNFLTNQQDYIQGYADLLESYGVDVPEEVYQKLIDIENQKRENLVADLKNSQTGLRKITDTLLKNAVERNPEMLKWTEEQRQAWLFTQQEYVDAYNTMTETEGKIQDCDIATAEWIKTIRELDFEKFDRFISRLDDVDSEMDRIRGLFEDDDVANEDGTWTKEGITSLGLAVQQMELAKQKSREYGAEISSLGTTYEEYLGKLSDAELEAAMSEQEWYDRLQTLKDGQWDAIDAYEAAKDAIVDMEEARIDAVEEGYQKEIDAMSELIELRKEELDAQRDLYDFNKKVKNQKRELSEIDRRIASLSGSSADADIAELRKLQAERRELQEGLDDTYYQHSKDSQSKALDDELESFQRIREDYIDELRETLEETATVIAEKLTEVLVNADVVNSGIQDTANEYGVPISNALMAPWVAAKDSATEFKNTASDSITSLINESGIITLFGSDETKSKVTSVFSAGTTAAEGFASAVATKVGEIKTAVENSTSPNTANLVYPWETTAAENGPIKTFSTTATNAINGAVKLATEKARSMYDQLSEPWLDMTGDDGPLSTFNSGVESALNAAETRAKEYVKTVNSTYAGIQYPSYTGTGETSSDDTDTGGSSDARVKALQQFLNKYWNAGLDVDGKYGNATTNAVKNMQKKIGVSADGLYGSNTVTALNGYYNNLISNLKAQGTGSSVVGQGVQEYIKRLNAIPVACYAKGTMGTKNDQWAITDESWIGEEITLAAGKNGQLQYIKKGSAVMPADISANLVEWGKLNPNTIGMSSGIQGVNLMSNYINKPELNLSFDALVKAEKITEETLPAVKKLVTEELDKFTRKLNYALKRA